jgi:peptidoglycan/LPS O-acetylase OafA/YrhL
VSVRVEPFPNGRAPALPILTTVKPWGRTSGTPIDVPIGYDEFRGLRYFTQLDGVRAISILLVITAHIYDPMWAPLHGQVGVIVFFVLSGFLITTLLLRESHNTSRVSLTGFYLRRAFRILPLYYVCLLGYAVLVLVLKLDDGQAVFRRDLPLYLTYNNEFQHGSKFGHTWSLAVEEKYYLVWPLIAFVFPFLARRRLALAVTLTLATGAAAWSPVHAVSYFGFYTAILAGCVVAVLMHERSTYTRLVELARPRWSIPLALLAVVAVTLGANTLARDQVVTLTAALLIVAVLGGSRWLRTLMTARPLVYIGTRSYAVYLIHPILKNVTDLVLPVGTHNVPLELMRFAVVVAASLAGAEVLYRVVEQPMILLGRRLTDNRRPVRSILAETGDADPGNERTVAKKTETAAELPVGSGRT